MSKLVSGNVVALQFAFNETDLLAPTVQDLVSPVDGYITEVGVAVQKAVTTGGTVTVKVGTTAVDGLSVAVANSATKGTTVSDTATPGHASRKVSKGDRIQVVPASFATAGALNGYLRIESADTSPALPAV